MPFLYIRTINQKFQARDEGHEYANLEKGRRAAIAAATAIASEEIVGGQNSVIIESFVEDELCIVRAKLVISLNVGEMML